MNNNQSYIASFTLRESGRYHDGVYAPLTSTYDKAMGRVAIEAATNGFTSLSPAVLNGVASNILIPSRQHGGIATVANGWGTSRLFFHLEIYQKTGGPVDYVYSMTGFTDHLGYIANGTGNAIMDEKMMLRANNIIVCCVPAATPIGQQQGQVIGSGHVLSTQATDVSQSTFTQRPMDAINQILVEDLTRATVDNGLDSNGVPIKPINLVTSMVGGLRIANRNNALPANYLAHSVTAIRNTYSEMSDTANTLFTGNSHHNEAAPVGGASGYILANAAARCKEYEIASSTFFSRLADASNFRTSADFTYGTLKSFFPNVDAVAKIYANDTSRHSINRMGAVENTNGLTGADNSTFISKIFATSIPAIMVAPQMRKFSCTVTNMNPGNINVCTVHNSIPFTSLTNAVASTEFIRSTIETSIMAQVPLGLIYTASIDVDCMGDTTIMFSMDSGVKGVPYIYATAMDAVTSPLITRQANTLNCISNDIQLIANDFIGADCGRTLPPININGSTPVPVPQQPYQQQPPHFAPNMAPPVHAPVGQVITHGRAPASGALIHNGRAPGARY